MYHAFLLVWVFPYPIGLGDNRRWVRFYLQAGYDVDSTSLTSKRLRHMAASNAGLPMG